MIILPTGHMTGQGGKGLFARFIIKTVPTKYMKSTPGGVNIYDDIGKKKAII